MKTYTRAKILGADTKQGIKELRSIIEAIEKEWPAKIATGELNGARASRRYFGLRKVLLIAEEAKEPTKQTNLLIPNQNLFPNG